MKKTKILSLLTAAIMVMVAFAGCSTKSAENSESSAGDFDRSAYLTEDGFFKDVDLDKYVTLGQYKNIAVPKDVYTIDEQTVKDYLDYKMSGFASYEQLTSGTVKDGDTVNIDYVGSVGGVEFEGGSTNGYGTDVTIGVTSYIDGFLEQLIGRSVGETFDINVTFPQDYGNEDLNGKDAVFNITINYLRGEQIIPELTDEFVKEQFGSYGCETVEELKEMIREDLSLSEISDYAWHELMEGSTVTEIPEKVMEFQKKAMLDYYNQTAQQYGITLEEYLANTDGSQSVDEFVEKSKEDLEAGGKEMLILLAAAKAEGYKITEEDIKAFIMESSGSEDYSEIEELFGLPYIKMVVMQNKIIDLVLESVVKE